MMTLSLTFDHRVVDGAPAMTFLKTLARYLEQPVLLIT
jgi:pyruvate dehydrogenase E2 component (dihydrolipoamide acetyltransferase)